MQPISHVNTDTAQALREAERAVKAPKAQKIAEEPQSRPARAVQDRYAPAEKQNPSGLYRLGRAEDGKLKICFDGPEKAPDASQKPEEPDPENAGDGASHAKRAGQDEKAQGTGKDGRKESLCKADTDSVDREIERLKKKKEVLEKQLCAETDGTKTKALQRQLEQVKRELAEKDNDSYRRQHTTFTQLG